MGQSRNLNPLKIPSTRNHKGRLSTVQSAHGEVFVHNFMEEMDMDISAIHRNGDETVVPDTSCRASFILDNTYMDLAYHLGGNKTPVRSPNYKRTNSAPRRASIGDEKKKRIIEDDVFSHNSDKERGEVAKNKE